VEADTFQVDRLDDPDPTTAQACTAAALDCSLRGAINAANLTPAGPHTVSLPAGTFLLTRSGAVDGDNSRGDLDILAHVIVQGAGMNSTTIDAGGDLGIGERVFQVTSSSYVLELGDLEITGGRDSSGAGILSYGSLTLERVRLRDNIATGNGGAIRCDGVLTVLDSEIVENTGQRGGGLYGLNAPLQISGTSFRANEATLSGGGAYVSNDSGDTTTFTDCVFEENHAPDGGGFTIPISSHADMVRCRFIRNQATHPSDGKGGGLYLPSTAAADIQDSSFLLNLATAGGGIWAGTDSQIELTGSTLWQNSAAEGGGIYCDVCGKVQLNLSTLSENSAVTYGGAVRAAGGVVVFDRSTVSANRVVPGPGSVVYSQAGVVGMSQSVLDGDCFSASGAVLMSEGGNVESPGDTCNLGAGDTKNVADPLLSQAWDWGGLTWTVLPRPGSPVVGASAGLGCGSSDQRGEPTPVGDCDSGSVERQGDDPDPIFIGHFETGGLSGWSSYASLF